MKEQKPSHDHDDGYISATPHPPTHPPTHTHTPHAPPKRKTSLTNKIVINHKAVIHNRVEQVIEGVGLVARVALSVPIPSTCLSFTAYRAVSFIQDFVAYEIDKYMSTRTI